jgi:hypothetical protein
MVSYWLGHADINTTHIYVEIDMEMKRMMYQSEIAVLPTRLALYELRRGSPRHREDFSSLITGLGLVK